MKIDIGPESEYGFGGRERSLGLNSLINCSKAVATLGGNLGCPVFNKYIPSERWIKNYIDSSVNILLTEEDVGLHPSVQGAVFKKKNDNMSLPCKNIYLVYLSNNITGKIKRLFVLSHELGHILLHGRILNPGMMLNLTSQNWDTESTLCKQMEAEANIFSLISLIPDKVINTVRARLDEDSKDNDLVSVLVTVLSNLFQEPFPTSLVRDRLLVQRMINAESGALTIADALASIRIRSWIGNDTNYIHEEEQGAHSPLVCGYLVDEISTEIDSLGLLMH